jgi:hypothetical protein
VDANYETEVKAMQRKRDHEEDLREMVKSTSRYLKIAAHIFENK